MVIVDTEAGNVFSLKHAVKEVGGDPLLSTRPSDLLDADRLLLPGVGALKPTIARLNDTGLADAIVAFAASGKPLLGICLGMQILMSNGIEGGGSEGLSIIAGDVVPMRTTTSHGQDVRLPHIGWSTVRPTRDNESSAWSGATQPSTEVYFAHSYVVKAADPRAEIAAFRHGGHEYTAVVRQDNVLGVQFHPECSGKEGLRLLASFLL